MAKLAKNVYGEALFSLARERGETDGLMEELQGLRQVLADNGDFLQIMTHPQIPTAEKQTLLETVFRGQVSETMLGFLKLLTEKGHFSEWSGCFDVYEALWRKEKNIGVAYVTSAMELTETQMAQIQDKLLSTTSFASIETRYEVDKSLIGGIVVRIGDRVVDGSIRHRLDRLTRSLNEIQLANE